MIKKHLKITIIIITILILIIGIFYLVYKNENTIGGVYSKYDLLTEDEKNSLNLYHLGIYEAISRDSNGKVLEYKFIKLQEEQPIKIEIMSDVEKQEIGLSPDTKIQVLQRSREGKVIAYRLIKKDSDILMKY